MIHRAEHNDNFTVVSNDILSSALSDGAKILLLYMLSCRDDWKFSTKGLASVLGVSVGAVNSRIKELQSAGHLVLKKNRTQRGYFTSYDWDLYELPYSTLPNTEKLNTDKSTENKALHPYSILPNKDLSEHGFTEHGKSERITNTNNKQVLNITSTKEKKSKEKKFRPPTLEEVQAYCQSRNSDVDPKKFFEYYDTGGWKDAKGNSVKNWKQKLITWEGRQKARPKTGPIQDENPFTRLRREEGFI